MNKIKVTFKNGDVILTDDYRELNKDIAKGYIESIDFNTPINLDDMEGIMSIKETLKMFDDILLDNIEHYVPSLEKENLEHFVYAIKHHISNQQKIINMVELPKLKVLRMLADADDKLERIEELAFASMSDHDKAMAINKTRTILKEVTR